MNASIQNDAVKNAMGAALNMCDTLRRDYRWTKNADAARQHNAILRDLEVNFLPRTSGSTTGLVRGAIRFARAEGGRTF